MKISLKYTVGLIILIIIIPILIRQFIFNRYDFSHLVKQTSLEVGTPLKTLRASDSLKGFDVIAENDFLELLIDQKTTEIAVLDKRNGQIWYSNPAEREQDNIATPAEKESMASQLVVSYYDKNRKEIKYNNYSDSIKAGQYEIVSIKDGVRITYTLGNLSVGSEAIPRYISDSRFQEKILSKLDKSTATYVKMKYTKSKDNQEMWEFNRVYENQTLVIKKILDALEKAGYTKEDLDYDNKQAGIEVKLEKDCITIPLEYRLVGDKLCVTVHTDKITETEGNKLATIELLKFFGAGGLNEEGYIVLPNGSGSIINFNNGKVNEEAFNQPIYGLDTLLLRSTRTEVTETCRLPVYGIKKENGGLIAIISEGDTIASLNADISGKKNSFNIVYPRFLMRTRDLLEISGITGNESDMTIVEKDFCRTPIVVEYCFLDSDQNDYSGMAQYYQDYLVQKGVLSRLDKTGDAPFYLSLIGAVEKDMFFIGFPYNGIVKMSTLAEANIMLDEMSKLGINNVQLRYMGWFNGGINHHVPKNAKLNKFLGSIEEYEKLNERLGKYGGGVYPDVAFQLVSYDSKNYSPVREAARYLDGYTGLISIYDRALMRMNTRFSAGLFNINSPAALPGHIDSFIKSYDKTGFQNISLRDLGDILSSDKNKKHPVNRQIAKEIVAEQFNKLDDKELLISGGNAYALSYASHLVNIPDTTNKFYIIDEEIPFYQMVIHGYIDYSGGPINLSENYDMQLEMLKMLEYGLAPHYLWSYEPTVKLRDTAYEEYYSTHYRDWIKDAAYQYKEYNNLYSTHRTMEIVRHVIHGPGLRETVFEDGSFIIVNYNSEPRKVRDITIGAKDYSYGGKNNEG